MTKVSEDASQEEPATIWPGDFDPSFRREVSSQAGGENIERCIQCGTCSGACPVWRVKGGDDPQKIIKMILLGMKKDVLNSNFIWLCATCYVCAVHCPQGISFGDLTLILRGLALKENIGPAHVKVFQNMIKESGRLDELNAIFKSKSISYIINSLPLALRLIMKGKLRLIPKPPPNVEGIEKIFESTDSD